MPNLRRVGQEAEDRAAEFLMEKGLTILTRRFTTASGELDLVALDDDTLVFVEVKVRHTTSRLPEQAVNAVKLGRLRRAAAEYVAKMDLYGRATRFDVVAIDTNGIRHYENVLE